MNGRPGTPAGAAGTRLGLRTRERRLLVLAAVLGLGFLSYTYGVEPWMERHAQVQELAAARRELLARQRKLLAREARYRAEKTALEAELLAQRARLLPGDRPPLAASELQRLVKSTAQDTGIEIRSERILPTAERGGYTEVPIEVTLAGPIRALASLAHRLEATPALLAVNELKVRVVSVAAPRELSATLSVSGYIASPGGPGPGRPAAPPRRPGG